MYHVPIVMIQLYKVLVIHLASLHRLGVSPKESFHKASEP